MALELAPGHRRLREGVEVPSELAVFLPPKDLGLAAFCWTLCLQLADTWRERTWRTSRGVFMGLD